MLQNAGNREKDFTATAQLQRDSIGLLKRKIWLPKLLYDSLPFFYMFAGLSALVNTIYIGAWYWVLPHYLLISAACLHLCMAVLRRRRTLKDIDLSGSVGNIRSDQFRNQA